MDPVSVGIELTELAVLAGDEALAIYNAGLEAELGHQLTVHGAEEGAYVAGLGPETGYLAGEGWSDGTYLNQAILGFGLAGAGVLQSTKEGEKRQNMNAPWYMLGGRSHPVGGQSWGITGGHNPNPWTKRQKKHPKDDVFIFGKHNPSDPDVPVPGAPQTPSRGGGGGGHRGGCPPPGGHPSTYDNPVLNSRGEWQEEACLTTNEMARKKSKYGRKYKKKSGRKFRTSKQVATTLTATVLRSKTFIHTQSTTVPYVSPASGGAGEASASAYSANSIYIPFNSWAAENTKQPLYVDQLGAQYKKCLVIYSSIRVDAHNNNDNESAVLGISIRDDTTTLTAPGRYQELPETVFGTINAGESRTYTSSISPNKWLGVSHPMSDATVIHTQSTNPTRHLYWHVWACPLHSASPTTNWNTATPGASATTIDTGVSITYKVVWFEPRTDIARSLTTVVN